MTPGGRSRRDRAPAPERPRARTRGATTDQSRAQTQQDFALGVSVFLLAVVSTFAILPTTLTAGGETVERQSYAAERTASAIVDRTDDGLQANVLDATKLEQFFRNHRSEGSVVANFSLSEPSRQTRHANVTLEPLDGGPPVDVPGTSVTATAGDPYQAGRTAGTAARVVRVAGSSYRLVVTVW